MISEECHYVGQIVRGQQAQPSPECWVKFFDSCDFFFSPKKSLTCASCESCGLVPEGIWFLLQKRKAVDLQSRAGPDWLIAHWIPPFFCANGEVSLSRHLWKSRCYKSFRYFQWEPQVYTQTINFERSSRLWFHMTGHCRMERGADLIFRKKTNTKHFYLITTNIKNKTRPFTTKNHPKIPPGVGPVVFYQTASQVPNSPKKLQVPKFPQLFGALGQALLHMKEGDKWEIYLPAKLGYGEEGTPGGPIPPRAALVFQLELLDGLVKMLRCKEMVASALGTNSYIVVWCRISFLSTYIERLRLRWMLQNNFHRTKTSPEQIGTCCMKVVWKRMDVLRIKVTHPRHGHCLSCLKLSLSWRSFSMRTHWHPFPQCTFRLLKIDVMTNDILTSLGPRKSHVDGIPSWHPWV